MSLSTLFAQAASAGGRCDLRYKDIDADGAAVVAEELSKNPSITSLNLWKNAIAADGAKKIASALTANTTLLELDVEGNRVGVPENRAPIRALIRGPYIAILQPHIALYCPIIVCQLPEPS